MVSIESSGNTEEVQKYARFIESALLHELGIKHKISYEMWRLAGQQKMVKRLLDSYGSEIILSGSLDQLGSNSYKLSMTIDHNSLSYSKSFLLKMNELSKIRSWISNYVDEVKYYEKSKKFRRNILVDVIDPTRDVLGFEGLILEKFQKSLRLEVSPSYYVTKDKDVVQSSGDFLIDLKITSDASKDKRTISAYISNDQSRQMVVADYSNGEFDNIIRRIIEITNKEPE